MEKKETIVISGEEAAKISKIIEGIKEEISLDALKVVDKYLENKRKEEIEKKKPKHKYEKVLHNTELLIRNYRNFKQHISTVEDLEEEIMENWDIDWDNDEKVIDQILKTRARTIAILKHIDKCLKYYEIDCESSPREDIQRRFKVINMLYISDKKMSHFEVAKELRRHK